VISGQPSATRSATLEAVHAVPPAGQPTLGIGGRWLMLRSEVGPEPVEDFLERVLGIVRRRVRQTRGADGQPLYVFEFPDISTSDTGSGLEELADLLERVEDAPEVVVGERDESRVDLHEAGVQPLFP